MKPDSNAALIASMIIGMIGLVIIYVIARRKNRP